MTARSSRAGRLLALTAALCGTLAVPGAEAAPRSQLVYRGCSHFIAPLCMGLTSRGKTYVLSGAFPPVPPGIGVDVYGRVTGPGACGTAIQVSSWQRNNKLRC